MAPEAGFTLRKFGETQGQKRRRAKGKSPGQNLPIKNYQTLTVPEVKGKLGELSKKEIKEIRKYESTHKNRKTLMGELEERA